MSVLLVSPCIATEKSKIIGYYGIWSPKHGLKPEGIPGGLLTHVIYSFVLVTPEGECKTDPEDKINVAGEPAVLLAFSKLKLKYPKLKLMLSIGGWGHSDQFSALSQSAESRTKLARSCVSMMRKYHLDGLDIDWEYPEPRDRQNFVNLLKDFRTELKHSSKSHLLLSVATSAYPKQVADLDVKGISASVDWIGLMAYDLDLSGDQITTHHAGLFRPSPKVSASKSYANLNGETAVQSYLKLGASRRKIILGVPFYGRSFGQVENVNHGLYQKFSGRSETDNDEGSASYREIKTKYLPFFERHWDPVVKSPWLYSAPKKAMVSYEDPQSLKIKARFVRKQKIGGIMIWELNQDAEGFPLLHSIFSN
jgi:chitinase